MIITWGPTEAHTHRRNCRGTPPACATSLTEPANRTNPAEPASQIGTTTQTQTQSTRPRCGDEQGNQHKLLADRAYMLIFKCARAGLVCLSALLQTMPSFLLTPLWATPHHSTAATLTTPTVLRFLNLPCPAISPLDQSVPASLAARSEVPN